jgi:hypothetical protein
METPKEYYYTYYSYEEWGRGYFGSRGCKCLPEEDINYLGSPKDKIFKPTQKIILKDDYATREEAYADEIILHQYYKVVENPHFANRAYQTSTKFYVPKEQKIEIGKKTKELKLGFHAYTAEERKELGKKCYAEGKGIASLTKEQLRENAKKADEFNRKNKIGFYSITPEQRRETVSKTNSQKWMCLETGYITTSGPLTLYQKNRGIDTTKRVRIS